MALIELHPDVDNYIVQLSLSEITRRGGVADLVESGNVVIIEDFRLDFDFAAIEQLSRTIDSIEDEDLRWKLKKLEAPQFFQGSKPRRSWGRRVYADPIRQALFEVLCEGNGKVFDRAARALESAHEQALQMFERCFCGYQAYRLIPSVRLTRTLFENLHWDDHSIDDDFHQARVFANLDTRPRIWNLSHRVSAIMERLYEEHDLSRFAGRDPNEMLFYINSSVLGGSSRKWMDQLPRHRIAFDPGEVWLAESRLISHQIYYGEAALVYMWFVKASSMRNPDKRFNAIAEQVHARMAAAGKSRLPVLG